jgi:hypothetical protein
VPILEHTRDLWDQQISKESKTFLEIAAKVKKQREAFKASFLGGTLRYFQFKKLFWSQTEVAECFGGLNPRREALTLS